MTKLLNEFSEYFQVFLDSMGKLWIFLSTNVIGEIIIMSCIIVLLFKIATEIITGATNR